jgi:hypothetical protein
MELLSNVRDTKRCKGLVKRAIAAKLRLPLHRQANTIARSHSGWM